jgi:hypothetical protein
MPTPARQPAQVQAPDADSPQVVLSLPSKPPSFVRDRYDW